MTLNELGQALQFVKSVGHVPYLAEIQVYSLLWKCANCYFILDLEGAIQNSCDGDFLSCDECLKISEAAFIDKDV